MKNLILFLLLTVTLPAYAYMLLPIDEVYDGDTIKTHFSTNRLPEPLNKVSIRIMGIDTPELPAKSYYETGKLGRAECVQEAELALAAKAFVQAMAVGVSKMKVDNFKWDKYGGRIDADVKIGGKDVAQALIKSNLAVQYDGGTKTKDWCE